MNFRITAAALGLLCLSPHPLPAQPSPPADEATLLRRQLQQLQEEFDRTRRQQQQQIDALTRRLDELSGARPAASAAATLPAKSAGQDALERQLAAELASGSSPPVASSTGRGSTPAEPVRSGPAGAGRSGAYMNLSFGTLIDAGWSTHADPTAQLELGDHDPAKRGFSLRNAEVAVDGAVDPYLQGFANIVLKLDRNNETEIELEESFVQTTALPANLQLKAGQYFANFGRQNPQHPHTWAFIDQPLILSRAFGPDGLRSIGAQVAWLAPTPFYSEVFLSVLDGEGGTAFSFRNPGESDAAGIRRLAGRATIDRPLRGAQDLLYVPRIAASFEPGETQTVLAGISGAFGPNSVGRRTEIYGADIFWKWKPATADKGYPFLSWQTEVLYRRFAAAADPAAPLALPAETLRDRGVYSQVVWGFRPRWNAGLRGEYVTGNRGAFDANDPFRGERYRFSPALTFLPSEFSKLRLQYNHDHGEAFGTAHSIWMQLEFGLGAHAAHKF